MAFLPSLTSILLLKIDVFFLVLQSSAFVLFPKRFFHPKLDVDLTHINLLRFIGIYSLNFAIFLIGALRSKNDCVYMIAQTNTWRHLLALFVWIYLLFLGICSQLFFYTVILLHCLYIILSIFFVPISSGFLRNSKNKIS
ncbi:hypothetical protein MHBO_000393 [Bonamia ostreae]|uniref:Uncharacterized protein n=1 Tax=Bonamia ostreae TaxID=126728 RepID=A0ABV2AFE6_9EUKA